jgi:hypothetical protein
MASNKKDSAIAHMGIFASAGAAQASASILPYVSAVGFARANPMMIEVTGVAFVNLPPQGQIGDEYLIYTRAGATPTVNVSTTDTLLGAAVVMAANTMISMQCIDLNATTGVRTWIREG